MIHTNTMRKAAGASNTNGLHTDTNGFDFPTIETTDQVHAVSAIAEPQDLALTTTTTEPRAPLAPAPLGAKGWIKPTSSVQGTTRFISSRNTRLRVRLVTSSNPVVARLICFIFV